ncbi:MAG: polysaccharide biosynthesis C-terminal domain-containing protein, partial [candidate division Zixibacteria bacterium]|nr:polysaccharide biosynthesis C-terminal domain-containing protein [candidate division Zixibacteria bacterium]
NLKVVADMSERILKYLFYLCTGACCGILIFGADFIRLWMGPGFELTVDILYILAVPAIIFLPQVASNSILFGIGKHRLLLVILAVEAVANIALSLVLVFKIGILGVALGTAIPQIIIYSFVYPIAYHRVLKASVKRFYVNGLRSIFLGVAFACPVGLLIREYLATKNWTGFSIGVILTGLVILAGFVWLVLKREDRRRIWSSLRKSG